MGQRKTEAVTVDGKLKGRQRDPLKEFEERCQKSVEWERSGETTHWHNGAYICGEIGFRGRQRKEVVTRSHTGR